VDRNILSGAFESPEKIADVAAAVPTQTFSSAPFALMIFALLLVSIEGVDRLLALLPTRLARRIDQAIRGRPPAELGKPFAQE